jgi:hypothetical protein
MTNLWVILDIALAAFCLFQAGKFGSIMDIDRQEGRKTETTFHVLYWLDIFFGLYFIICVYGKGIERGLQ